MVKSSASRALLSRRRMFPPRCGASISALWPIPCRAVRRCSSPPRSAMRSPGVPSPFVSSMSEASRKLSTMTDTENKLTLETTQGNVVIELRPDLAPKHVERIKQLVGEGFYDGIVFHRVIDGFMAQTGCPHGTGTGGSDYPDLKAEFSAEPHVRGTASMARAQSPNSANSQFF